VPGQPLTEAFIRLRPDTTGFKQETEADLQTALGDAGIKVKIRADTTTADEDLGRWRQKQEREAPVAPKVRPDIDQREIDKLQARLNLLGKRITNTKISVDDKDTMAKMAAIEVTLGRIGEKVANPSIDVGGLAKANADILALDAQIDRLGAKSVTANVNVDTHRSIPELGNLMTAILALAPAMAPVGAAAIGLGGTLVAAFTPVAIGLAGVSFAGHQSAKIIKTDLKAIQTAQTAMSAAKTPAALAAATEQYKMAISALTPAEKQLMDTQEALSSATKDWAKSLMPAEAPAYSAFLKLAQVLMKQFYSVITAFLPALTLLEQKMTAAFGNPMWTKFFQEIGQDGQLELITFGRALGNLATGFIGLYNAFRPLVGGFNIGLISMSQSFAKWGQSLGASAGFQAFIDYLKTNGPILLQTLGSLTMAIITLLKAMAPFGPIVLQVIGALSNFIVWMGAAHPTILNVVVGLVAFGAIGLKVFGIISTLIGGIGKAVAIFNAARTAILLFTGAETIAEAVSIGFTGVLAALGTAMELALGPVGLVILAIAALIAAGILIYKNWGTIWPALKAIWTAVWRGILDYYNVVFGALRTGFNAFIGFFTTTIPHAVQSVLSFIQTHWKLLAPLLAGPLAPIVFLIIRYWSQITGAFSAAFGVIERIVSVGFKVLVTVVKVGIALILLPFDLMYRALRAAAQLFWGWTGGYFRTAWRAVAGVITAGLSALRATWNAVWGTITNLTSAAWKGITTAVSAGWKAISAVLNAGLKTLSAAWNASWKAITAVASAAWKAISGVVSLAWRGIMVILTAGLRALNSAWTIAWRAIRDVFSPIWRAIAGLVRSGWQTITSLFRSASGTVSRLWSNLWSGIHAVASSIWSTLERGFRAFWGSIQSGVLSAVSAIGSAWSAVKDTFEAPVKWVIDHVYNNGLRKAWNDIASIVHLPNLPEVKLAEGGTVGGGVGGGGTRTGGPIPTFASGGLVPVSPMVTNRPTAIVGEGNPRHPEFVIPTDPRFRGRAMALYHILGDYMGSGFRGAQPASQTIGLRAPGMAAGGALSLGSILGSVGGAVKGAASATLDTVKDAAGHAVHLIRDGAAWSFNKAISPARGAMDAFLGNGSDLKGALDRMGNNAFDAALRFVSGKEQKQAAAGGNSSPYHGSGSVQSWILQALKAMGIAASSSLVSGIGSLIMSESGGNPNAVNNWDSNAAAGHPSKGLMQTIASTFAAYVWPAFRSRSIFDPIANITAGVRYAIANYGIGMLEGGGRHTSSGGYEGYKGGSLGIPAGKFVRVGDNGPEIASFTRRTYIAPKGQMADTGTGAIDYHKLANAMVSAMNSHAVALPPINLSVQVSKREIGKAAYAGLKINAPRGPV
jgi:SLT domain-containing protein